MTNPTPAPDLSLPLLKVFSHKDPRYGRARYARRKRDGICVKCKLSAVPGIIHCFGHMLKTNRRALEPASKKTFKKYVRKKRKECLIFGLCVICKEPLQASLRFKRCPTCRARANIRVRAYRKRKLTSNVVLL